MSVVTVYATFTYAGQAQTIGEGEEGALAPVDAVRPEFPLHQRPIAGDIASIETGHPGAQHQ